MDYNNNYYFWTKTQDTIKDNVQKVKHLQNYIDNEIYI